MSEKAALLVVAHGSREAAANEAFLAMVAHLAGRAGGLELAGAFLGSAEPMIPQAIEALAGRGIRLIQMMPWFLHEGRHARHDLGEIARACEQRLGVTVRVLPSLQGEMLLEEVLLDRAADLAGEADPSAAALPLRGDEIAAQSRRIIDARLAEHALEPSVYEIVRRVIHSTADFSFARTLRVHPQAVEAGVSALRQRRPIICDVRMLQAGITAAGYEPLCAISDADVIEAARQGTTRAAAAIQKLADKLTGAIVAIGNAPTALWKVMELARSGIRPALVVGLPVGFVGARESKLALLKSDLVYVTNTTCRGGSPAAAAVVNALAVMGHRATEDTEKRRD